MRQQATCLADKDPEELGSYMQANVVQDAQATIMGSTARMRGEACFDRRREAGEERESGGGGGHSTSTSL